MTQLRIRDAAVVLGVSDDTVRRWVEAGRLQTSLDAAGRKVVAGLDVARLAEELARDGGDLDDGSAHRSARNHFTGIVTDVISDAVMSQVTLQCGPHRVVSLISTEAVRELQLVPGTLATAVVKATNVTVETLDGRS
ncbi:MAG TPA: TOBE domain-containing protein [Propionibacteriaceae bacterium]|nr:TOBE domain-containing protein [Propionibacteriaceae bacterium]HPZ50348.1 TOBE domain-containing protein [Propionibacteriaceae bacterium]